MPTVPRETTKIIQEEIKRFRRLLNEIRSWYGENPPPIFHHLTIELSKLYEEIHRIEENHHG